MKKVTKYLNTNDLVIRKEELSSITNFLRKHNLPLFLALESAIKEQPDEVKSEDEIIKQIQVKVQSIVDEYASDLTFSINYYPGQDVVVEPIRQSKKEEHVEENVTTFNADNCLMSHELAKSVFDRSFTISNVYYERLFSVFGYIPRGNAIDVIIMFQGITFKARLDNLNTRRNPHDIIKLYYQGGGLTLGTYLRQIYPEIYNYFRDGGNSRDMPNEFRKMLEFRSTEERYKFNLVIRDVD